MPYYLSHTHILPRSLTRQKKKFDYGYEYPPLYVWADSWLKTDTPWDDWCQNQDAYKCCDAEPEKDAAIAAGTLVDDLLRVNCEDPKEVEWSTQKKFQNFGNNLLRIITPQIDTGVSFPKPVWVPNQ